MNPNEENREATRLTKACITGIMLLATCIATFGASLIQSYTGLGGTLTSYTLSYLCLTANLWEQDDKSSLLLVFLILIQEGVITACIKIVVLISMRMGDLT